MVDLDAPLESVFSGFIMTPVPAVIRLAASNPLDDLSRLLHVEDALGRPRSDPSPGVMVFELVVDGADRIPFEAVDGGDLACVAPVGAHAFEIIVSHRVTDDRVAGRHVLSFNAFLEAVE